MDMIKDFLTISRITNNIYLSGIFPLENSRELIKKLGIKYILSCVDRNQIQETHDKVLEENPNVSILYLPYNDNIQQNLWIINYDQIKIVKKINSISDQMHLFDQFNYYKNRPLIDIGYYYIEKAVSSGHDILIHCMAGMSRSASLVIYYLMRRYHMDYDYAYDIVKRARSIIKPNISFRNQLKEYNDQRHNFSSKAAEEILIKLKTRGEFKK